jgi:hypothetical protein
VTQLSPHFVLSEFACRCGGKLPGCRVAVALPALVTGLEALRTLAYPHGLAIESGYRCPERNRQVGGAKDSQHQYGSAADVALVAQLGDVARLGVFSGIGWQQVGGRQLVRHVDVRAVSGHNFTRGTAAHPTLWEYS